jgi:hypothetical protein
MPTKDGLYLFFRGNFLTTRVRRALYHALYEFPLLIYDLPLLSDKW